MSSRYSLISLERDLLRLGDQSLDKDSWCRAADDLLRTVTPFDGSCWHTIDPATLLITGHLTLNLPNRFPQLAANEYLADDVNRFADLAAAPRPVATLERATEGRPERSLRYREMLLPNGFASELRVSLLDGQFCWGSLILVRDRGRGDFDNDDIAAIETMAGVLARGLRRMVVTAEVAVGPTSEGPGLLVLDRSGEIESLTPSARHWLRQLGGNPPPVVLSIAAAARRGAEARARARTPRGSGSFFTLPAWMVICRPGRL
jgi:GAF domain-containing protein